MFELRPYQNEALAAIGGSFLAGTWSQIVVLSTGSGKTEIFSRLRQSPLRPWLDAFPERQQKILVIAHREELIEQAAAKFRIANPDLNIGIEKAERRASWMDDVVIASVQTLQGKRLLTLNPDDYRIVIVDEAHHAAADSYQAVLQHFGLLPPASLKPKTKADAAAVAGSRVLFQGWWREHHPNRLLLGVTATPARGDAIGLEWTFQKITFERSLRWMIENGYLSPLRGYLVDTQLSLDGVKITAGDFNQGQLAEAVNTPERNRAAAIAWQAQCAGRRTLGFSVDIQHARDLAGAFQQLGIAGADWVSGDDPERASKVERFRRGEIGVLFNAQLLTEGFDLPAVSAILMAKPTTSQTLYMQMIGRGTRLADGKQDCIVLDVVDVSRRHSLVSLGDLFGLPATFDLKGAGALDTAALVERLQAENPDAVITGSTIEAVRKAITELDLWKVRESAAVTQFAALLWIEDNATKYHLPLPQRAPAADGEPGALDPNAAAPAERVELREGMLGGWAIVHVVGTERREIGIADTLQDAFTKGERWVENVRPDVARMKSREATWLGRKPTNKQRQLLKKLKSPIWNKPDMTRGEASALIDQVFARKPGGRPYWQQRAGQRQAKAALDTTQPLPARGQRKISLEDRKISLEDDAPF